MANRLLRNIAVSIGAGLATGFGRAASSRQPLRPAPSFYPLLTRLEDIESRVTRVELAPSALVAPDPEEIAALGTLVSSQREDIASLRQDIQRIERRNAEQVEAFGQKAALLEQQVSMHIETSISTSRITELEQKLRGEFQDIHHRTVDAFAATIERRVVGRIAALENSLMEQSQSIASLHEKSLKTEENLQRLLEAVEKLCARVEANSQRSPVEADQPASAPRCRTGCNANNGVADHDRSMVAAYSPAPDLSRTSRYGQTMKHGEAGLLAGEEPRCQPANVAVTQGSVNAWASDR